MICGIDEAGRGCIAGALYIAGCMLKNEIYGLNDSKKLTKRQRDKLFDEILQNSEFKIVSFSNLQIDEFGLSKCLKSGLEKIIEHFSKFNCEIIYDGNTSFGVTGLKTLVKADAIIPEVSAASILAKVSRDREITQLASKYSQYGFEKNKGYGSKFHIEMIKKYGFCDIHRKSFKLKALEPTLF